MMNQGAAGEDVSCANEEAWRRTMLAHLATIEQRLLAQPPPDREAYCRSDGRVMTNAEVDAEAGRDGRRTEAGHARPEQKADGAARRLPDEGRLHEICWEVIMNAEPMTPTGALLLEVARRVAMACGASDPAWRGPETL